MGATDFVNVQAGNSVGEAFDTAVEAAAWEFGHGGYTGTIAEKSSYVFYGDIPEGVTTTALYEAINDAASGYSDLVDGVWVEVGADLSKLDAIFPGKALEIAQTYDDKWGPACAFRRSDGKFVFMGLASD